MELRRIAGVVVFRGLLAAPPGGGSGITNTSASPHAHARPVVRYIQIHAPA